MMMATLGPFVAGSADGLAEFDSAACLDALAV